MAIINHINYQTIDINPFHRPNIKSKFPNFFLSNFNLPYSTLSLDRTNVVQSVIGRNAMLNQLYEVKLFF